MHYIGVFLLSVATLALEIALTRVFSLTQWYHFAFMAVAVALLGFGASGSFLDVVGPGPGRRRATVAAWGFAGATLALYPAINIVPFDAYRIFIDRLQLVYLLAYVLILCTPFFFSGLALGALLSSEPERSGAVYGANLAGSGCGCLLALTALPVAEGAGIPLIAAALALLAGSALLWSAGEDDRRTRRQVNEHNASDTTPRPLPPFPRVPRSLLVGLAGTAVLMALLLQPPALFALRLSPYKSLSIVSAFQGSRRVASAWNSFSRVDVVEGPAVRSAPGLSMLFKGELPAQPALTVDGDNLRPIPTIEPTAAEAAYADYLPSAIPFRLRAAARTLILQAGSGLEVWAARRHGAQAVTAVEANPLVVEMSRSVGGSAAYNPNVQVVIENGRSFLARSPEQFDVIIVSLAEGFRAVTAGDFSLSENYVYTVEAFQDYYNHLAPDGLLVATRWAQWPPSEDLRVGAIAAAALRRQGADPTAQVAVFRGLQTVTLLVRRGPFLPTELAALRTMWQEMGFDAVYYPGMPAQEANRFVVMSDAREHEAFVRLLRGDELPDQIYDISPTSDDRPFFFHLFRWSQMDTVLRNLGRSWQPFGGAGFLVLVALLVVTLAASLALIVLPLLVRRRRSAGRQRGTAGHLAYFMLLGLGFLFVEIPLLQRYILFLGQPVFATAVVLFALLTASALGSAWSKRLGRSGRWTLPAIAAAALLYPSLLSGVFDVTLGAPLAARLVVAALSLMPLGFLLGIPFPWGLRLIERVSPGFVPWAWAANGCASVLSSVLATMVAVTWGFTVVLASAALAYGLAWLARPDAS